MSTEEWDFLLVDEKNAVNKIDRVGMLWTVRHLWPSEARFFSTDIVTGHCSFFRNSNSMASTLHCREGVTQGDSFLMIVYRIGIIPLIKILKRAIHDVTQPWYADNSIALGTFSRL